ncbi:Fur family transcriptional regulator [Candidatus Omnitrophota bacterium]
MVRQRRGKGRGWLHGQFNQGGFRMTMPRQAIFDVLKTAKTHLSSEEVYLEVHKTYPRIGLTTVYRTLELMDRMGLVYKCIFGDGRARYELSEVGGNTEHHHHLVCTSCGKIVNYTDFSKKEIATICGLEDELAEKHNFDISHHFVQFYGTCNQCRRCKR